MPQVDPHPFLIRRATPQDAPGIHAAHMRSIQEVCAKDYAPEQIAAWSGRPFNETVRLKAIQDDWVWVVAHHDQVAGYAHLRVHDGNGELFALYLAPEALGKGFGRELLGMAEEQTRRLGCSRLRLNATRTAESFYRSQGFEATGPGICQTINGEDIPCQPMSKRLVL